MDSFLAKIKDRLNNIEELENSRIGFEFEFYSNVPYYKTLELLNKELDPVKVYGYRKYHSSGKIDEKRFKLEPDFSGGPNMCELITCPLDYNEARIYLIKICNWIKTYGETSSRSSIHMNISFNDLDVRKLDPIKLILDIDENWILHGFSDRKNNVYAKSLREFSPTSDLDYSDVNIETIRSSYDFSKTKYHGINFSNVLEGRIEWRYLGGEGYENKTALMLERLDYFILKTRDAILKPIDENHMEELSNFLEKSLDYYKSLQTYEDFIANFPKVSLQIDMISNWSKVSSYYNIIFSRLFKLISSLDFNSEGIINWDSDVSKFELVEFDLTAGNLIEGATFIGCDINKSQLQNCEIIDCDVKDSIIDDCDIKSSVVKKAKLISCKVDKSSTLEDVFFFMGFLDGHMKGGVFRSGKLGKNSFLDTDVEVLKDDNFFGLTPSKQQNGKSKFRKKSIKFGK